VGSAYRRERLHQLGLVNQITVPCEALSDAVALAQRINARAPNALASVKELLSDARLAPLSRHLAAEKEHFVRNLHHPNGERGISAFLKKTTPRYE
jgi:enoyl-CoA hydratase/carnithine racemase